MNDTRYYGRKQSFFAAKCKDQTGEIQDGRKLRKWINPQDGTPGETWEYQEDEVQGLTEYLEIRDGKYGQEFMWGMYDALRGRVNVLQFKLTDNKGNLHSDIVGLAKKVRNLNLSEPVIVGIWENFKGATTMANGKSRVPSYVTLKQGSGPRPDNIKSEFEYDEATKTYKGLPSVEKKETFGGKIAYNSEKRDQFLFELFSKWIADSQPICEKNKALREQTPSEVNKQLELSGNNIPSDIEEDVPF